MPATLPRYQTRTYAAILRTPPSIVTAETLTSELASGTLTAAQLQTQLLSTAQNTTIVGLLSYDFINGTTPFTSGLDYLANYAADLESGNYTYIGGFQLGTAPGEYDQTQFSAQNTYVNFTAAYAETGNNAFDSAYGSLAATASNANRTAFFEQVYQQIFDTAPAASTVAYFVNGTAAPDPAITIFQYYVNDAGSEIGGYGAIAGVLLWTAEASGLGPYPAAADTFLLSAAAGIAAGHDTTPYGSSLLSSAGTTGALLRGVTTGSIV